MLLCSIDARKEGGSNFFISLILNMMTKGVIEASKEGKCLNEQLQKTLEDINGLEKKCNLYKTEKEALRQARARLLVEEDSLDNLTWEEEILRQRFELMKGERDELQAQFERTIFVVQQQSRLNNLLLEKQLDKLEAEMEKRDGYVSEMLSQAGMDHDQPRHTSQKNDALLREKKGRAEELQAEIVQVKNNFDNFLKACQTRGGDKNIIKMKTEHIRLAKKQNIAVA